MSLWGFLTIAVISCVLLMIVYLALEHQEKMKKLEIEALKIKHQVSDLSADSADSFQLESENELMDSIVYPDEKRVAEKMARL